MACSQFFFIRLFWTPGTLVYMETPEGNDAMVWLDEKGEIISESLDDIFKAAACHPDTPALERSDSHHEKISTA
jgi:hypothetical protein